MNSIKKKPVYTIPKLLGFVQQYADDALWNEEEAQRVGAGPRADALLLVAAKLKVQSKGYLFRAREMAYDAAGGRL